MKYKQEDIKPYDAHQDKGKQVEAMFNHIAPTYDKLNHRMSLNIDKRWRRYAVKHLLQHHPQYILDVASGTGDFALLMAERLKPQSIIASDISDLMMEVGRRKSEQEGKADIISFRREDAMQLSFDDNTFDAVTATFGIRNFPDLERGLREMYRVLRPKGQLCILELTTPKNIFARTLFKLYSHTILPLYGKFVARDTEAYQYLSKTIEGFPQAETMMDILSNCGFTAPEFKRLTMGVCTLYTATKE